MTGSTQGITFRIKPPTKAYRSIFHRAGTGELAVKSSASGVTLVLVPEPVASSASLACQPCLSLPEPWTITPEICFGQPPDRLLISLRIRVLPASLGNGSTPGCTSKSSLASGKKSAPSPPVPEFHSIRTGRRSATGGFSHQARAARLSLVLGNFLCQAAISSAAWEGC